MMVSGAESWASRSLRAVLASLPNGAEIPESQTFRDALSALDWFVPQVLEEIYPEWRHESLDGIISHDAKKVACREAEILGWCWLISDQSTAPIHLRLRISAKRDEITWFECRLGETQGKRLARQSLNRTLKRLYQGRIDEIEWFYRVTFGDHGGG